MATLRRLQHSEKHAVRRCCGCRSGGGCEESTEAKAKAKKQSPCTPRQASPCRPSRPSTQARLQHPPIDGATSLKMLPRSTRRLLPAFTRPAALLRPFSSAKDQPVTTTTDNPQPANTPNPEKTQKNFAVSSTNALPSSSTGSHDHALQESPEEGEAKRVMQAPNREGVWSRSQQPRSKAMVGPRFEQTIMEDQVRHTQSAKEVNGL